MSAFDEVAAVVDDNDVTVDPEQLDYLCRDLSFESYERAELAVAPATVEQLQEVVRRATSQGLAVVPRGGGMSYTQGYTPGAARSVLVDMGHLDSILEINEVDGYVRAQCGATWESVYRALREKGLRTGYYGPLSGRYATVGGALSQNSVFWGAAKHGTLADTVLSMEVVTANGELLRTGGAGRPGSSPCFRNFGPDLTGLFVGDTGALGVKAVATLRTVPFPEHTVHHSVSVPDFAEAISCMQACGRFGIATEVYNLDPYYARALAAAGVDLMSDHPWTVHMTVDGDTADAAEAGMDKLRDVASTYGEPIDPVVPTMFRDDPFGAVQSVLLGPEGELWLPIHGLFPFSAAHEAAEAVRSYCEDHAGMMRDRGIEVSFLTACERNNFLFEPAFYWKDELGQYRLERISPEAAANWREIPPDESTRAEVLEMRRELAREFDRIGGVHIQIGKYYPYQETLESPALSLVAALKKSLDPEGLMNPGCLGFR